MSSKFKGKINGLKITFSNVTGEESRKYLGAGKSESHVSKNALETIETSNIKNNHYEFSGYIDRKPWYQWSFKAESYEGNC